MALCRGVIVGCVVMISIVAGVLLRFGLGRVAAVLFSLLLRREVVVLVVTRIGHESGLDSGGERG